MVKSFQSPAHMLIAGQHPLGEGSFQTLVGTIVMVQKFNEVEQVSIVESSVLKTQQLFQILGLVLHHKLVGCTIHSLHQLVRFVDNSGPDSPCKYCCKQTCNFSVCLFGKLVWNGNRVLRYERRLVELKDTVIKEGFEFQSV